MFRSFRRAALSAARALVLVLAGAVAANAQGVTQGSDALPTQLSTKVRAAVLEVMQRTGVPSASVGIVRDGHSAYVAAFGKARLEPPQAATPDMHYAVGSISKQFTASAVMLLQQEGKLSVDDPVSRWFPELTRAKEVKLRNLLSHTSGYEDYAPQDYTIPAWTHPSSAERIVHEWATKPLDFDPGTQYQYSNTNYDLLGLIVQKVSGQPFWTFLKSRVLDPVGLTQAINLDTQHDRMEPVGYARNALGPLRPAIEEAPGWYFADGELAMPVGDLLKWDISVMSESLLSHASYAEMESPTRLRNGLYSNYGFGLVAGSLNGHRMISHTGEVGGFVAWNAVFPDNRVAIAVLTNQEASPAAGAIGRALSALLIPPTNAVAETDADKAQAEQLARTTLAALQRGAIDRSRFTANASFYFTSTALTDYASSLGHLGVIKSLHQTSTYQRGGMTFRGFAVEFANGTAANVSTFTVPDGKYEQFLVEPTD